jgi:hypothetical protein
MHPSERGAGFRQLVVIERRAGALCQGHAPIDPTTGCEYQMAARTWRSAAKDIMTVEQYHKLRNHLEDKYTRVRLLAAKFAEEVIK